MSPIVTCLIINVLKLWVFIYECLTYPFYFFYQKKLMNELKISAMPIIDNDSSSPWRNVLSFNELKTTYVPGCATIVDMWDRASKLWPQRDALGTRELISSEFETQDNGRQFQKLVLGDYHWESYSDVNERILNISSGLLHIGLRPRYDRILIFAETRAEWMIMALSAFKTNVAVTTLYATLGEDAIVHGIIESETSVVVTSNELLPKTAQLISRCPRVKHIIFMDNKPMKHKNNGKIEQLKEEISLKLPTSVQLIEVSKFEELGERERDDDMLSRIDCKPDKDDTAIIMYTSGSTGIPKGVEITQGNLLAAIAGMYEILPKFNSIDETYVSYLPLAHVMELLCEFLLLTQGIRLGYSSPLTLTDTSSKIKKGTKGDVSVLKPTLMVCVPTILERLTKAVWTQVHDQGPFFSELFKWACEYKRKRLGNGYPSIFMDKIVFRRIKKILGGKIRYMLSGGAPLTAEAQNFINICFTPIVQGYGLTETCAAGSIMTVSDLRTGHGGPPLTCLQIKLREWPEGGYSPSDLPNPRGEILIGGPNVCKGYFKQPELTKENFFEDDKGVRWFCTGDIGSFSSDGCLSIIDRKKDLVKLQGGEYVSLGKVELAISTCSLVETVCVYADSIEQYPVCIISPRKKQLIQFVENHGVSCDQYNDELELIVKDEKIIELIQKEIIKVCQGKKIERFEIPQKVYIDSKPWTPDTGLVTDALKLKRRAIQTEFKDVINSLYQRPLSNGSSSK